MLYEDIIWASADELSETLRDGRLTVSDIAEAMISRIDQVNGDLNALIYVDRDQIRRDAQVLDDKKASGAELGPLFGLPYTLKLLTQVEGLPANGGLLPLKDEIGGYDAAIVQRMRAADGLFLGKTNSPEFGYYGGTNNHLYGQTQNPHKPGYSPGGSSGGAAAAVTAGIGVFAEGGDGAGSVRIPAALSGCVGFKPSHGRIPHNLLPSRFETWAFHGPLTRTVADAALMLDVVSGYDPEDPLSLEAPAESYLAELAKPIDGWRIGYSADMGLGTPVEPAVARICREAVDVFTGFGATVTELDQMPWTDPEQAMWEGIWIPGFASEYDLIDWEGARGQVDDYLIDFMAEVADLTAAEIGRADLFRGQMYDAYTALMADFDLIVSPTLSAATFPVEQFAPDWLLNEPVRTQILAWLQTYPYNMTTAPAITIPAGFTADGRPVGLQIGGRLRADGDVLAAAAKFESARPWIDRKPALPFS